MYLSNLTIENFRCFGDKREGFELALRPGLTALVGENDAGKSAVIDALRFALGTTDQEWIRLEDTDFHDEDTSLQINIVCRFAGLTPEDKRAFVEYLTYDHDADDEPVLYVNWAPKDTGQVRSGRTVRRVEVCSGKNGDGPALVPEVRELLTATYLRPLRGAEQALSAGRGSRLSQVLHHTEQVRSSGEPYRDSQLSQLLQPAEKDGSADEAGARIAADDLLDLSVLGIADLANDLLGRQKGIEDTRKRINEHLAEIALAGDGLKTSVGVSGTDANDDVRLRQLLEKLDVTLGGPGRPGLGSGNLLFIACELLLLAEEKVGSKLLLIEEPEAHLHPQRQLRVMKYLQAQADQKRIQVIVTTHSPNLASVVHLDNMVMIQSSRAFPLAEGQTELATSDYRFLERFLDVTKANLFFARGVLIVEGAAESILLPTLAALLGRDLTEYGVSIVNVGGVGLGRYARILKRKDPIKDGTIDIRVACVTDMDVMPDCAPAIIGKVREGDPWPPESERQWRAKKDIGDTVALSAHREQKGGEAPVQNVQTFVSDEWTFEYDIALGLAEDVYVAACLAAQDDALNAGTRKSDAIVCAALARFEKGGIEGRDGCTAAEVCAAMTYAKFAQGGVSKAVAAQYLAERLKDRCSKGELTDLRERLPKYLVEAIDYVTRADAEAGESAEGGTTDG